MATGYATGPKSRCGQHRQLLDAIVAGDGDKAEELMLAHTERASHELIRTQTDQPTGSS